MVNGERQRFISLRSLSKNGSKITLDSIHSPLRAGFRVKNGYAFNSLWMKLGGWDFPEAAYVASLGHLKLFAKRIAHGAKRISCTFFLFQNALKP